MVLYNLACIQSLSGKVDECKSSLERALQANAELKEDMKEDPDLDAARSTEWFKTLLN